MAVRQSRLVRKKRKFFDFNWLPWQRPLRYRKKKTGLIICRSIPTIWCKDCENWSSGSWDTLAPSEQVRYETKLIAMATSLEILKKNFRSVIYIKNAFIWYKNCRNRTWFVFFLRHKIGCNGNVSKAIKKRGPDQEISRKYLSFGAKIVKIGPVDPGIICLKLKKEEINASKIYSPSGKFAERAKQIDQVHGVWALSFKYVVITDISRSA